MTRDLWYWQQENRVREKKKKREKKEIKQEDKRGLAIKHENASASVVRDAERPTLSELLRESLARGPQLQFWVCLCVWFP